MNTGRRFFAILMTIASMLICAILIIGAAAKDKPKIAYLTFDDGPTLNTPSIIQTLEKYNAKATFFVLEERIILYPDFIKEIVNSGNSVGLHGVSHNLAIYATINSPLEEMNRTNKALENLLGKGARIVRVPYGTAGHLSSEQAKLLEKNNYIIWDWNVDPRDSVGKINPEKVLSEMRKGLEKCNGDPVILLHDRKSTAELLPAALEYLTKNGYTLLPISEKQKSINFLSKNK